MTIYSADGSVRVVPPGYFRTRHLGHWRQVREQAKIRDDYTCTRCGGASAHLEVHHLTYARKGRELLEDVVTVCQPCHPAADRERRRNG